MSFLIFLFIIVLLFYFLLSLGGYLSIFKIKKNRVISRQSYPSLSIIKPVYGLDEDSEKLWTSWLKQKYKGKIDFIFSLQSKDDPALPLLQKLKTKFNFEITINPVKENFSGKMSNLFYGLKKAKYDFLIFSDDDIFAPSKTIEHIGSILIENESAICACTPIHLNSKNIWGSIYEMTWNQILLHIITPSIICGKPHGFAGGTIGIKRETLDTLGGLEKFSNIIAEDFAMGHAAVKKGIRIVKGPIVTSSVGKLSLTDLCNKLMRSHLTGITMNSKGLIITLIWYILNYGYIVLISLSLLINKNYFYNGISVLLIRFIYIGFLNILTDKNIKSTAYFIVGDIIILTSFIYSFFVRKLSWGGDTYKVLKNGYMQKI